MGVYVYKSKHMNAIKVGHYCKNNAWSRIARRGFYSCKCPEEIKDKVGIDDVDLLCWYPTLTAKDEKKIHAYLMQYSLCGEWFRSEAVDKIADFITEKNQASECVKEEAVNSRKRL
jgi:hypothetical protein